MTSRNRTIGWAMAQIAVVATAMSILGENTIIQGEGGVACRMISIEVMEKMSGDLRDIANALLELLDCEDDGDVGLTD